MSSASAAEGNATDNNRVSANGSMHRTRIAWGGAGTTESRDTKASRPLIYEVKLDATLRGGRPNYER